MSRMIPIHLCLACFCKVHGLNFVLLFTFRFSLSSLPFRLFRQKLWFSSFKPLQFGDSEVMQFRIKPLLPATWYVVRFMSKYLRWLFFLKYIHSLLVTHCTVQNPTRTLNIVRFISWTPTSVVQQAFLRICFRSVLIKSSLTPVTEYESLVFFIYRPTVTVFTVICYSSCMKGSTALYALWHIGLLFECGFRNLMWFWPCIIVNMWKQNAN